MKVFRTFLFLLVFAAAFTAFFFFKYYEEERQAELSQLAKSNVLFPNSMSDEINYLRFEKPGKYKIDLKKENENWLITSPAQSQSDVMVIQGIIAALRFGKKEEIFVTEDKPEDFGFKNPFIKISVGTVKSRRKSVLLLGSKAPVKKLFYAKWEGGSKVFLISEKLYKSFDRELLSLRRRLAFDFDSHDVRGFRICRAGKFFDVVKIDNVWQFTKNTPHFGEKVDPTEVANYLEFLRGIVVNNFMDDADLKSEEYGIKLRQNYVNVYFDNAKPQILYLGYPSRDITGTYVHMDRVFNLGLVHSRIVRRLDRDAASFYERRIWRNSDYEVERISLQLSSRNYQYHKKEGKWFDPRGNSVSDIKRQWIENTVALIQELRYDSTYESNFKDEIRGEGACLLRLFSGSTHSWEKPFLEIDLGTVNSQIQGIANSSLEALSQPEENQYQIFKLNAKDSEFLSEMVKNII